MAKLIRIFYDHDSVIPKEIDRNKLIPLPNRNKLLIRIKKYAYVEIDGIKYYLTR